MPSQPANAYSNHRFLVEIDGLPDLDFTEVVLPEASAEVIEYREGGERAAHKIVGLVRYSHLVLRRGVTESNALFAWWNSVANGAADRRNIAVVLLDQQRQPVKRWRVHNAWPARYAVAPLIAAGGATALLETLECATEGLEQDSVG